MEQLLTGLQSIDLSEPGALLEVLTLLFNSIDWWWLFWVSLILNAFCAVVGAAIGWRKDAVWRDALLGATLGPIGWIISLVLPPGRSACIACGRNNRADARHCDGCGARMP